MGKKSARIHKTQHADTPGRVLGELALLFVRSLLWVGFTAAGTALNMWGAVVLLLLLAPSNFWGYLVLGFGAALAGGLGGAVVGFGQALALRRWLDGAASLGSFFSTVLASSTALASGTLAGWGAYSSVGDLAGAFFGVVVYGGVFGLIQRPMLDYMTTRSILWIPTNVVASVLGAVTMLAAFDVSGGRRDMLQFRYAGIAYALVVGAAFLWMTRETRRAMAARHIGQHTLRHVPGIATDPVHVLRDMRDAARPDPPLLEIHEHRVYRVYNAPQDPNADRDSYADSPGTLPGRGNSGSENGVDGPGVIDATYRVIS